jgi:hypothetical protein
VRRWTNGDDGCWPDERGRLSERPLSISSVLAIPRWSAPRRPFPYDSQGCQHRSCVRSATASLVRIVDVRRRQHPLRNSPCRQRLCGCPQGVNRAALHRTALEPWVRLPALNRDGSKAVARVQHLNHGLDVALWPARFSCSCLCSLEFSRPAQHGVVQASG